MLFLNKNSLTDIKYYISLNRRHIIQILHYNAFYPLNGVNMNKLLFLLLSCIAVQSSVDAMERVTSQVSATQGEPAGTMQQPLSSNPSLLPSVINGYKGIIKSLFDRIGHWDESVMIAVVKDLKKNQRWSLFDPRASKLVQAIGLLQLYKPITSLFKTVREDLVPKNERGLPQLSTAWPFAANMARQIGLDPNGIELYNKYPDSGLAGGGVSFTRKILGISSNIFKNLPMGEQVFLIGHEFSHLKHAYTLKKLAISFIAPWIAHALFVATNRVIQKGLSLVAKKFHATSESRIGKIIRNVSEFTDFFLRFPLMEYLCSNRLTTYYVRSQEKLADLESATKFNCAEHAISFLQKADESLTSKTTYIGKKIILFLTDHPSYAERIAYLKPIAEAQKAQAIDSPLPV